MWFKFYFRCIYGCTCFLSLALEERCRCRDRARKEREREPRVILGLFFFTLASWVQHPVCVGSFAFELDIFVIKFSYFRYFVIKFPFVQWIFDWNKIVFIYEKKKVELNSLKISKLEMDTDLVTVVRPKITEKKTLVFSY